MTDPAARKTSDVTSVAMARYLRRFIRDTMISDEDTDVTAQLRSGEDIPLIRKGRWVFATERVNRPDTCRGGLISSIKRSRVCDGRSSASTDERRADALSE